MIYNSVLLDKLKARNSSSTFSSLLSDLQDSLSLHLSSHSFRDCYRSRWVERRRLCAANLEWLQLVPRGDDIIWWRSGVRQCGFDPSERKSTFLLRRIHRTGFNELRGLRDLPKFIHRPVRQIFFDWCHRIRLAPERARPVDGE